MLYLILAFSLAWACQLIYLIAIDRQIRQMKRRIQARAEMSCPSEGR